MQKFLTLDDVKVKDKVVLVRVDFNSAIDPKTHKILEDARIRAHAETTIKELAEKGAKVVILAHQGRKGDPDFIPLKQHAEILSKILKKPVKNFDDLSGKKAKTRFRGLRAARFSFWRTLGRLPVRRRMVLRKSMRRRSLLRTLLRLRIYL